MLIFDCLSCICHLHLVFGKTLLTSCGHLNLTKQNPFHTREGREGMIHTYPLVKEIKKTTTASVDISSSASKCSPS